MSERLISVKKIGCALVLLFVAGACSSGGHRSSGSASPSPTTTPKVTAPSTVVRRLPVSARLELPSTSMAAGSVVTGHLLIENNSGAALCLTIGGMAGCTPRGPSGCAPHWAVVLASSRLRQTIAFPSNCMLQALVIRTGETKLRFTLEATYDGCSSTGKPQGTLFPACLPGPQGLTVAPPLPADLYYATFTSNIGRFTPVACVPVRVLAHP